MTTYGWQNDQGEPIMDGAAYRFEQQLDSEYQPDPDDFYADAPETCFDCGEDEETCACWLTEDGNEDSWLDGSYEE